MTIRGEIDLKEILNDYSDEIKQGIKKSQQAVADDTVNELKASSPKRAAGGGAYAGDWTSTYQRGVMIVHNAKHYQLTHLLEFGHATRDGGRTRAYPHIKPASNDAAKEFEDKIKDVINHA
ncbi:HK97 gp10 family phage protein [Lacticaseibacillus paracasei]|uniref:HK97 gp10 family phage protein n=1 Tax=Lacticaseibacillus paracasei TaxID=1597 RepID=A0ABD7BQK2_LACPA|nr:HK97 gp10 family phage protein [Lacticaseibacillus paracasei]QOP54938.1 HK97 gp10 family phage protein [Lacticaseibacillus paracasei]QPB56503.1 HK97 gp10 family phage protein [Lacticaseibacillus paracasei]WPQ31563.1 HK97 gp10 family phage protein [Lacticaseibacillus paracasei]